MRVRLPVELTGCDLDATIIGDQAHVEVPGVGRVVLPAASVVEVKEPLPEEPPVGSVVLVCGEAGQRFEDNDLDENPSAHWASVGTTQRWTWPEVVRIAHGDLVAVVPAPEPVELPWTGEESDGNRVIVERYDAGNVSVVLAGRATAWFPLAEAEKLAAAIATAAQATP